MKMEKWTGGIAGTALILGGLSSCKTNEATEYHRSDDRPNIVMFLTDDNAFTYWGFGGGPGLSPNIDSLVARGVEATEFYAVSSVCTPSRYNLHTAKYAGRCEDEKFLDAYPDDQPYNIIWNTFIDDNRETTLGELMQNAGYTTGFVGKWHLGFDRSSFLLPKDANPADPEVDTVLKAYQEALAAHIRETGYDYAASLVAQNNDDGYLDALQHHNLEWYAKGAIDFIEQNRDKDKPFFLIVNITTHHGPCHIESIDSEINLTQTGYVEGLQNVMPPRESIFERIREKGYPVDFKTAGTVWTDDCVGAVLDKISQEGMEESTAVVFTTDHNRFDGKATNYQGGVHIPFSMKWPGIIEEGTTTNKRMQMTDLLPTFLEMAGGQVPDSLRIDGKSRLEELVNSAQLSKDNEDLYFEFGYSRAVLSGKYKYIALRYPEDLLKNMKNGRVNRSYSLKGMLSDEPSFERYPYYFDADQLYDLENDPGEQHNLAYDPEYEGTVKLMREKLRNFTVSFDNVYPLDDPDPFYTSAEYEKLNRHAREDVDMQQFYWYRKGCY